MPNGEALNTIRNVLGDAVANQLQQLRSHAMEGARACRIQDAVDYLIMLVSQTTRLSDLTGSTEAEAWRELNAAVLEFETDAMDEFARALVEECGCRAPSTNHRPPFPVELNGR